MFQSLIAFAPYFFLKLFRCYLSRCNFNIITVYIANYICNISDINYNYRKLKIRVIAISKKARKLGVKVGDTGQSALNNMC